MKYDYTGTLQISIIRDIKEDKWWWGWIAKSPSKWLISHGSGNNLENGDEFIIDKDTHIFLAGTYRFEDAENIICISPNREKEDCPKIKIIRV